MNRNEKYKLLALTISIIMFLYISGCKVQSETVGNSSVSGSGTTLKSVISGQVVSSKTGIPIDSALVYIYGGSVNSSTITNSQGKYSIQVSLSNNLNLTIISSKTGFVKDTTTIYATAGEDYAVDLIQLAPTSSGTGSTVSGNPVSIYLASQTASNIGVVSSGSVETATLTFVVEDSSGSPIDISHSVNVNFAFGSQPGGGEVLSPSIVQTNDLGEASVNITSGTKAGVVQVVATINLSSGKQITSKPVSVAIHGGLPDLAHFSIYPAEVNFPGYDTYGVTNTITTYVGDKYGNPVTKGTIVYFTTTGGIIQGSAQTDADGTGKVTLYAADPKPTDATLGAGYATITATTADENSNTLSKNVVILFSGNPQISVSPTTFDIPNGGSQSFTYSVSDENGNPLAGGTAISVSTQGLYASVEGDVAVTLPDTKDKSWTQFSFIVYDNADTVDVASPVSVIISSYGPNGSAQKSISGTSH
jgi:hypothetical protein